jgi:PTS system beta-glucosides-specific IIC component
MAKVDYRSLAEGIVEGVGGEGNIATATHCATRLRLKLRDDSKADKAAIEKLPGVITVMQAGGQYQVVVGNDVPIVYAELGRVTKLTGEDSSGAAAPTGNLFNRFIDLVSSIFQPIVWPLAGAGLLKALLSGATQLGWLSAESQTSVILAVLLPPAVPGYHRGATVQDQPVHVDGHRRSTGLPLHRRVEHRR